VATLRFSARASTTKIRGRLLQWWPFALVVAAFAPTAGLLDAGLGVTTTLTFGPGVIEAGLAGTAALTFGPRVLDAGLAVAAALAFGARMIEAGLARAAALVGRLPMVATAMPTMRGGVLRLPTSPAGVSTCTISHVLMVIAMQQSNRHDAAMHVHAGSTKNGRPVPDATFEVPIEPIAVVDSHVMVGHDGDARLDDDELWLGVVNVGGGYVCGAINAGAATSKPQSKEAGRK